MMKRKEQVGVWFYLGSCSITFLGLVLPSGEINWNCPCLGGLAVGPCSVEFRDAFSCFHNSKEEMKGSDCVENFQKM